MSSLLVIARFGRIVSSKCDGQNTMRVVDECSCLWAVGSYDVMEMF